MIPCFEALEPRYAPVGVRLTEGVLTIRGTPSVDRVVVKLTDDGIRVEAGKRWWQYADADLSAIHFLGRGGRDSLVILVVPPEPPPLPVFPEIPID